MQIKPIDQAPHDGSLQLVSPGGMLGAPFYRARYIAGLDQWIVEDTGNGYIEAVAWLDLTPKPT